MKKKLHEYIENTEKLIEKSNAKTNWKTIMKDHLTEISFYQHERLIHLIVTVTFAILAMLVFLFMISNFSLELFALFAMLTALLIPYIFHYYYLENNVQQMYVQYDKMKDKRGKTNEKE